MNYSKLVDEQLRLEAKKVPFNRRVVWWANIFQRVSFGIAKIVEGVRYKKVIIKGYKGLEVQTYVFEPDNKMKRENQKSPCLLYIHGGAFCYKPSIYHKKLAALYAKQLDCQVVFPDYHLSPKYPFPAAYEDVLAVYREITTHSQKWGIDEENVVIGGDSAGGSLAALLCTNYQRENLVAPRGQMLVYPVTDGSMSTESMAKFDDTPIWNAKSNHKMWKYYLKNVEPDRQQEASPMLCELPKNIPDTYIEVAQYDCLHDEGVMYARRLQEKGARVELNETKGTMHGYDVAVHKEITKQNVARRIEFMKRVMNRNITDSINRTKEGFEKSFAEGAFYNKQTQDDKHRKQIVEFLKIEDGMRILDLGTGTGFLAFAIATQYEQVKVTGLDIVEKALEINRDKATEQGLDNLEFVNYDGISFPFEDDCFDMIITRYAMHHFPKLMGTFHEISRVLKPGGRLFVSDPAPNEDDKERFVDDYMQMKKDGHIKFYSLTEWKTMAEDAGLTYVDDFETKIRFPKKKNTASELPAILKKHNPQVVAGYELSIKDEEVWITELVNNVMFTLAQS